MRKKIQDIINGKEGRGLFDFFIQFWILVSVVSFCLETLPANSGKTKAILFFIEGFCISIFVAEYILRIYASENPIKYITSFFGLIDLVSILPFFVGLSVDFRSFRMIRFLRLIQTLKLIRYNKTLNRFHIAANIVKDEMILFFLLTGFFIFFSGVGIYFFENQAQPEVFTSIFDSLWWAIVTLTTVGYGDAYPITVGGKIFTFFILIMGVGIVAVPAGLIATALSKAREIEARQ